MHQAKWDGYRLLVAKDGDRVRLYSKGGTEWTGMPVLAQAFAGLPPRSAVLDGELCLCDSRGRPDFSASLRDAPGRARRAAKGVFRVRFDVRERCRSQAATLAGALARSRQLCHKGRKAVPYLFLVESFPEAAPLLEWCAHYCLEGIVSKKLSAPCSSRVYRNWVKVKCDRSRRDNQHRHKLFEHPANADGAVGA